MTIGKAVPRDSRRTRTINIRVEPKQCDVIDRAAKVLGKDRSAFVVETAYREAERVLLDRRLFALDEKDFKRFVAALDAWPRDNLRLRELLQTPAPWNK